VYFQAVKATLTDLHRNTAETIRPVIHGGERLELTANGRLVAEIIPSRRDYDRKKAWAALQAFGEAGGSELKIEPRK